MQNVTLGGLFRNVGRALRRHCPACGASGVWNSWLRTMERCPRCGIQFDRGESDYFLGAYMLNLVAAELGFAALFIILLVSTWPTPPWTALTIGSVVLIAGLPLITFPYTRGIWLGVDLLFRPERRGDEV